MASTHTRKPSPRARRILRLPRPGWWWIAAPILLGATAKTWPGATITLTALTVGGLIVWAIRPAWARPLLTRIPATTTRPAGLPAPGRRTLAAFQAMDPTRFEHAITELARQHPDIRHAQHSGQTADRGMDVLAIHNDGRRILIQCKKYAPGNNVGSSTVREVVGSVLAHRCDYGVIVTTAGYTAEAVATNHTLGAHALVLIDGTTLEQWAAGSYTPWRH
jgi:restriction system protein